MDDSSGPTDARDDRADADAGLPPNPDDRTNARGPSRTDEQDVLGDDGSPLDGPNGSGEAFDDGAPADDVVAAIGVGAGALALIGTAVPYRGGATEPTVALGTLLAIVVLAIFFGRRYDRLGRRIGAPIAGGAGLLVVLVATYGLNQDGLSTLSVPVIGEVPALLVALLGGAAAIGAASADYGRLSAVGLRRRALATVGFSALGAVGYLAITAWAIVLIGIAVPLATGTTIDGLAQTDLIVISQVATVLGVGSVAVAFLVWTDRDWSFVDLHLPSLRDVGYVVGGFLALYGAAVGVSALLGATGTESAGHSTFEAAEENPEILLVMVVASILVIGPFEELLYRNVIQKSLYDYFSRAGAVVVASVPFAIVHFPAYSGGTAGQSLVSLGVVLALSLILGTIYARTENLVVPALVHGLFNAVVFYSNYVAMTS